MTTGVAEPFGPVIPGYEPLPDAERRERAAALAPVLRGLASTDQPQVGHFTDGPAVLDFLARQQAPRARRARHLVPRPFPSHQGGHRSSSTCRPLPRCPISGNGSASCMPPTVTSTGRTTNGTRTRTRRRCAGPIPRSSWSPGVGMFSFGADKQTARVAGEFYVNAINVMRGAEAVSAYSPIPEREKFRIEYWALEEAKLRRRPKPGRWPPGSPWSPAAGPASAGPPRSGWRPKGRAWSWPTGTAARRGRWLARSAPAT